MQAISDGFQQPIYFSDSASQRPLPGKDYLFKSNIDHLTDCFGESCSENPSYLVDWRRREEYRLYPTVHHGRMNIENNVKSSPFSRHNATKGDNVLCHMEGVTDLVDSFPLLLICGIRDYADSHSNNVWERYAIETAIDYARGLFCKFNPGDVIMKDVIMKDRLRDIFDAFLTG